MLVNWSRGSFIYMHLFLILFFFVLKLAYRVGFKGGSVNAVFNTAFGLVCQQSCWVPKRKRCPEMKEMFSLFNLSCCGGKIA